VPVRRFRVLAVVLTMVGPAGAWLACNPLFGIEEGNLVDPPTESGASDLGPESSPTDSPVGPADAPTGDANPDNPDSPGSPDADAGFPCGTIQCGDPLCCFVQQNLAPFCWHDGDVACAIQCRNDKDCARSPFGKLCCLNYASAAYYGSTCQNACDIPVCLNPGDCAGGAPCTARSCDGGTAHFNLCGDASPDPLCN
jgi:hypothetical protein